VHAGSATPIRPDLTPRATLLFGDPSTLGPAGQPAAHVEISTLVLANAVNAVPEPVSSMLVAAGLALIFIMSLRGDRTGQSERTVEHARASYMDG
jgi:hypothetical protein